MNQGLGKPQPMNFVQDFFHQYSHNAAQNEGPDKDQALKRIGVVPGRYRFHDNNEGI